MREKEKKRRWDKMELGRFAFFTWNIYMIVSTPLFFFSMLSLSLFRYSLKLRTRDEGGEAELQ